MVWGSVNIAKSRGEGGLCGCPGGCAMHTPASTHTNMGMGVPWRLFAFFLHTGEDNHFAGNAFCYKSLLSVSAVKHHCLTICSNLS